MQNARNLVESCKNMEARIHILKYFKVRLLRRHVFYSTTAIKCNAFSGFAVVKPTAVDFRTDFSLL